MKMFLNIYFFNLCKLFGSITGIIGISKSLYVKIEKKKFKIE